jgi:hypothetical protein
VELIRLIRLRKRRSKRPKRLETVKIGSKSTRWEGAWDSSWPKSVANADQNEVGKGSCTWGL